MGRHWEHLRSITNLQRIWNVDKSEDYSRLILLLHFIFLTERLKKAMERRNELLDEQNSIELFSMPGVDSRLDEISIEGNIWWKRKDWKDWENEYPVNEKIIL